MIKQRISFEYSEEFINEYSKLIAKYDGACDEVWLDWLRYRADRQTMQKYMHYYKAFAEKLREKNIKVSVEISSLGHHIRNDSNISYLCTDFAVDGFGTQLKGLFCFRSKEYRKILSEEIAYVCSELKPYAFYFDDDLRFANVNGPMRCFCDNCVKEFNEQNGTAYTREELSNLVNTNLTVREKFLEFTYQGLADFSYEMGKAIVKGSPETFAGVEHGGYNGENFVRCLEALHKATGKPVMSRSGAGAYTDLFPTAITDKALETQYQLAQLPEYVKEYCNEIENFPSSFYSKTPYGTCLEASLHFASGFNCTSIVCKRKGLDKQQFEECLLESSKRRNYWEALTSCNQIGAKKSGMQVFIPKNIFSGNKEKFQWITYPARSSAWNFNYFGIPITYSKIENPVYYVDKNIAEFISEEEMLLLAKSPVIIGGAALEILQNKGFGENFGVEVVGLDKAHGSYIAKFTKHEINKDCLDKWWGHGMFKNDCHYFIDKNGSTEALSVYAYANPDMMMEKGVVGEIADAIVTTKYGAKWFVQGYRSAEDMPTWSKRQQINNAIRYISGGLKAELISRNRVMLLPIENKDGKLVNVSLVNYTIEPQNNIEIIVRNHVGTKAVLMNDMGEETPLVLEKDGLGTKIKICNLSAWSIETVFFKD